MALCSPVEISIAGVRAVCIYYNKAEGSRFFQTLINLYLLCSVPVQDKPLLSRVFERTAIKNYKISACHIAIFFRYDAAT